MSFGWLVIATMAAMISVARAALPRVPTEPNGGRSYPAKIRDIKRTDFWQRQVNIETAIALAARLTHQDGSRDKDEHKCTGSR
jgi:hypothetical protein